MVICESILDQVERSEVSATKSLISKSRHPRTPQYYDFYIKIWLLKIALAKTNWTSLESAVNRLDDVLSALPYIDEYSDIIITDNFTLDSEERIYPEDEVETLSDCPYVCFSIKPDFRKFREIADFVCRISSPLKSYMPHEPMIEYVFPDKDNPSVWNAEDKTFHISTDAPLIIENLNDFLRVYRRSVRSSEPQLLPSLIQIESATKYISFVAGRLINKDLITQFQQYNDMYRLMNYYDVIEYQYEGTDLSTVRNHNPADMSIGFMQPIVNAMMQSEIDLDALYEQQPGFLRWFLSYVHTSGRIKVHSLLTESDREMFQQINSFSGKRVLRPTKIYFRLLCTDYPTTLNVDIYLGFVDLGIVDYKMLCISYPFYFYEENSTDYMLRRMAEEINEVTGVEIPADIKEQLTDLVNSNRIRKQ